MTAVPGAGPDRSHLPKMGHDPGLKNKQVRLGYCSEVWMAATVRCLYHEMVLKHNMCASSCEIKFVQGKRHPSNSVFAFVPAVVW